MEHMNSTESSDTKVIVVTCVKDEGWILDRFLATCSVFADMVIISDESTGLDNSLEIYKRYPKAVVHHNGGPPAPYDGRRRFVFDEARKVQCARRIVVAIDADEILSANLLASSEWHEVLSAEPGTLFRMQWVNLWRTPAQYKVGGETGLGLYNRSIWVDDGVSAIPEVGIQGMHMVYTPENARRLVLLKDIVCLHYQFCNWPRMEAKHRFYRAHEKVNIRKLSDLGIWRMYGYMNSARIDLGESPQEWFAGWEQFGIDMSGFTPDDFCFYDLDVLRLIDRYGADMFACQDIWRCDWDAIIARGKALGALPADYLLQRPGFSLHCLLLQRYLDQTVDAPFLQKLERHLLKGMKY